MSASVVAVHRSAKHGFSKQPQPFIRLLEGRGVEGDAHCGETVQHLYLKRRNAAAPNRMQVHLLPLELLHDLAREGFAIQPGDLGENITISGIALEDLPLGTRLHLGTTAVIELTGLRSPCVQIDRFRKGVLQHVVTKDSAGRKTAKAGVMSIVVAGGDVYPGDSITAELPPEPHARMTMI